MKHLRASFLLFAALAGAVAARAVDFAGWYREDFNSMGSSGTAAPAGWGFYGNLGGSGTTWSSSIPPADAGLGTANATLIATTSFSSTTRSNTQGYNFATSGSTGDRALGTSPTTGRGVALQLTLTNTTGGAIGGLQVAYDIRRFRAGGSANELPGHWLFYSVSGGPWTNVSALNPSLSGPGGVVVPDATGVTQVPPTDITLSTPWAHGANLVLRWVDDNAEQSSADQIIGLDNVRVTLAGAVESTLLPRGSVWRYLDDGSDQGSAWRQPGFVDDAWAAGPAELGYGDTQVTLVGFGPDENNKYPTTYFRTTFEVDDPTDVLGLTLHLQRDDGAVVYVNGTEARRDNMPAGAVTHLTYASSPEVAGSDETSFFVSMPAPSLLVAGTNTIAVEIHQQRAGSSDISFDLELVATLDTSDNVPPTISLDAPLDGVSFEYPLAVSFAASADDTDGNLARVEFLVNGVEVGEDASAPFAFAWTPSGPGTFAVAARAVDTLGASITTAAVNLTITPSTNSPPGATLDGPADNATDIGASTDLALTVSDADATVVTFYGRKTAPATPGPDFAIGTLPDTQYYSQNSGGNLAQIFHTQTQWYVNERENLNLVFVSHMGDFVQNGDNGTNNSEWLNADGAMSRLEDRLLTFLPYGLPWGGAPGNHDQTTVGQVNAPNAKFNQFFGAARFVGRPYFGGSFSPTNNSNNYQLFSASGLDFIIFHLDFTNATAVNPAVINWVDALMKAHPHRRAIVTSHWILNLAPTSPVGAPAPFGGAGQRFLDEFKDNPNFFMMWCGHIHGEGRRVDVWDGRNIYSVLQDFQSRTSGGNGWLRYFVFSPANNTITAQTYSPWLNQFETDTDATSSPLNQASQFTLAYDMQGSVSPWIPLGTMNVPAGGGAAELAWTGLLPNSRYEWYAVVNDGISATSTAMRHFTTVDDAAPTVAITNPAPGTSLGAGNSVTITADAFDDVAIARVEFYDGNTLLGTDSDGAPFEFNWTPTTVGDHVLSAVAVDSAGQATLSELVDVLVGNIAPTVTLTAPLDGATYDALADIELTAEAADSDGTIARVEFFENAVEIGEDTTAPYEFIRTGAITGTYTFTARAVDSFGTGTTSAPAVVTVTNVDNVAPSVAITAPANGSSVPGGTVAITVSTGDVDGVVTSVQFYRDATLLGTSTTAPFMFNWSGATVGLHTISAVATDNDGTSTSSAPVTFFATAPTSLTFQVGIDGYAGTQDTEIRSDSATQNTPQGSNPDISVDGEDSSDTGNNPNYGLVRFDNLFGTALSQIPTGSTISSATLTLTVTNPGSGLRVHRMLVDWNEATSTWASLGAGVQTDDVEATSAVLATFGADNGSENVPNGALNIDLTSAVQAWAAGAPNRGVVLIPFPSGTNGIDFQSSESGTVDQRPRLAVTFQPPNAAPAVTLTNPPDSTTYVAPALVALIAEAGDTDGFIAQVEFFAGAVALGTDTAEPFAFEWMGAAAGEHVLTAVATDNGGATTTSAPVTISVLLDSDDDGLPDSYESANGLNPNDGGDGDSDLDGDLLSARLEYALNTAANVPNRAGLPVLGTGTGTGPDAGKLSLTFTRFRGELTYSVRATDDLKTFTTIATNPGTLGAPVTVVDDNITSPNRYLQLLVTDGISTVTTTPLGRLIYTLAQNTESAVSFPLHAVIGAIGGQSAGFITAVGASTLDNFNAGWTPSELSTAATPYLVRITSGAAKGRTFPVATTTANTSTRLTLAVGSVNLTTLGIIAGVDTYELIPGDTLASLFPTGTLLSGTATTGDTLKLWNGVTWLTYFHNGANWQGAGSVNSDHVLIRPDAGWLLRRRGATTSVVVLGQVSAPDAAVLVPRKANTVTSLLPVEQTFAEFALHTRLPAWTSNLGNPAAGDHVRLWNGGAWIVYFWNGANWQQQGSGDVSATPLLVPGRPLFIVRPTGSGSDVLTQPKTY